MARQVKQSELDDIYDRLNFIETSLLPEDLTVDDSEEDSDLDDDEEETKSSNQSDEDQWEDVPMSLDVPSASVKSKNTSTKTSAAKKATKKSTTKKISLKSKAGKTTSKKSKPNQQLPDEVPMHLPAASDAQHIERIRKQETEIQLRLFVMKLQTDIAKIAGIFLQDGHFADALPLYGAGLQMNKYLNRVCDFNVTLNKGFAQCCFLRAKFVHAVEIEKEANLYRIGAEECHKVVALGLASDDITFEILPVTALYDLVVKLGAAISPIHYFTKIQDLIETIGDLSDKAKKHPDILKIKQALQFPQSPELTDSETASEISNKTSEGGAVGGIPRETSHDKKSKKTKKKKGRKKGRRKESLPTDSPRTRGAKKKRTRKKYKYIVVKKEDQESDEDSSDSGGEANEDTSDKETAYPASVHEGKGANEGQKYKGNIAEIDEFEFDTLPGSESSESEISAHPDLEQYGVSGATSSSTGDYGRQDSSASNKECWEVVGPRRSASKTITRYSSSERPIAAIRPPKESIKKKKKVKNKPVAPHSNVNSGAQKMTTNSGQIHDQFLTRRSTPQTKLTPRMKICLDRVLSSNRGSFMFLCDTCLRGTSSKMVQRHEKENRCNGPDKHPWSKSKVMVYIPEAKGRAPARIRPRPRGVIGRPQMCWHVNSLCRWGEKCTFAHNEIEKQIWDIGGINYDEVVKHCSSKAQPLLAESYCCTYCDRSFTRKSLFEDHINTDDHKTNITSDHDRPWKYREPPSNVINGLYTLCQSAIKGTCSYSNMDPMDNSCPKAHTEEELQEWVDRYSYRRMKIQKAKDQRLFSFMDDLLAEYNFSMTESEVMTEIDPDGVQIHCQEDLTRHVDGEEHVKKQVSNLNKVEWNFTVKTTGAVQLKRVGLLHDTYRTNFSLSSPTNATKPQVCPGTVIKQTDSTYHIKVVFESRMLGSFKQWIVFDFNAKPVIIRKLGVSVGGENIPELAPTTAVLWDSANSRVIRYPRSDVASKELESQYKLSQFKPDMDEMDLSCSNYKHFMHNALWLEEKECMEKLASFKHETTMLISNVIIVQSLHASDLLPAQPGHLFGQIDIAQPIFGDSVASQIALTSVRYVLLRFDPTSKVMYEAEKVDNDKGGQTQDSIYVRLSPECVAKENLMEKIKTKAKIGFQFCVDRLHFCRMHRAVDNIVPDIVFPTRNEHPALICPDPNETTSTMNSRQLGAARFIESTWRPLKRLKSAEVLLVYGPFGTGKTHTLAHAVMNTLTNTLASPYLQPRIMICTHSNPAADLYITDFFDSFVKSNNGRVQLRRIVAEMRKKTAIPEVVRQYVLFDQTDPSKPKELSIADVKACHIVIATTTTAMQLAAVPELKGHFSHILIDEAGQVLESECIIPLALAGDGTCIVLAGDHLQTAPKVYSPIARKMNFHKSLLERLFEHSSKKKCRREVFLTANYRTCPEILTFLSKNFYTAAEIEACGNQPRHGQWYPLEFREVFGEDKIVGNSYINVYESQEIVKRIQELVHNWPADWGPKFPEGIGVLAPYKQQVDLIRHQLRRHGLRDVFVDRLQAIQGKQFRVVIISTVRTQATINPQSSDTEDYLGFLSEARELNTALTRTRSLVIAVGDPCAVCFVGDCCNVWKKYIKECEANGSLYGDVSYKELQRFAKKSLNPHAKSFIPSKSRQIPASLQRNEAELLENYSTSGEQSTMESLTHRLDRFSLQEGDATTDSIEDDTSSETSASESDDEDPLNMDDIILKELRRQLSLDIRGEKDPSASDDEMEYNAQQNEGDLVMIDEEGHVRLGQERTRPRPEVDTAQSGETILCTFHIDHEGGRYAIPKESRRGCEEIYISNNTHRGTALVGDEVLVEILENSDAPNSEEEAAKVYGKVVRVVTPLQNCRYKKLVCRADPFSDNLMVPLGRHLPKIYVLKPKTPGSGQKDKTKASLMVRICHFRKPDGKVTCIREVEVSPGERPYKLFLVKWLKWERVPYALGMVTDVLPDGDNHEDGLMILKHIYDLTEDHNPKKVKKESSKYQTILQKELRNKTRTDLRDKVVTFTIDPPDSQDLDDALSIEQVSNDRSEIGVHIADVSCFIPVDSDLDKAARARATSFYPSFTEPIHMLPTQLSTDICSLLPDQDKLTLSVFFTMDKTGNVVDKSVRIERSIIASSARLSYDEADDIILEKPSIASDQIKRGIALLHSLAAKRRKQRLQDERYSQSDIEAALSFRAHYLVEEMMLVANEEVAKYLMKAYPESTPLRRQPYPERERVQQWMDDHGTRIELSGGLLRRQNQLQNQCGAQANSTGSDGSRNRTISITKDVWNAIVSANSEDFIRLAGIVCTDQYHPQLAPVRAALHRFLQPAEYICSGTTTMRLHGSLDMQVYTHFTSPIRRYIDMVVHRQLIAAIAKERVPTHSKEDVSSLCHVCNIQNHKAKEFELKARALNMAMQAMTQPIQTHAFIEDVSTKSFQVIFPPEILPAFKYTKVAYKLLKPIESPEVSEEGKAVTMKWKESLYSVRGVQSLQPEDIRRIQNGGMLNLDTHERLTHQITAIEWRGLQQAIAIENFPRASSAVNRISQTLHQRQAHRANTVQEVTCEMQTEDENQIRKQYVKFQRPFTVGDTLAVQLHSGKVKGMITPSVQLLNVTPNLDFCFEHRSDPVHCFTGVADRFPNRANLRIYKQTWLPIIEMEAAYSSVSENNTIIIQNVTIEWQLPRDKKSLPCGSFSLSRSFCEARHINCEETSSFKHSWLCLRYSSLEVPSTECKPHEVLAAKKAPKRIGAKTTKVTFVAHATVPDASLKKDKENERNDRMTVFFEINQTSTGTLPVKLLRPIHGGNKEWTVEFIPYNYPSSRLRIAVESLWTYETPDLIQNICLLRNPREMAPTQPKSQAEMTEKDLNEMKRKQIMISLRQTARQRRTFSVPNSRFQPNRSQTGALKAALEREFTLIQGPPGTGKTITGAYLVYFFSLQNQHLSDTRGIRPQILYCGPSNKSVDVITGYLKQFQLSIIRVYSKNIEANEFPIPGVPKQSGKIDKPDVEMDPRHKMVSLHHLIRQKSNTKSGSILQFDEKFRRPGYQASPKEAKEYAKLISLAEAEELNKYQVILCTCNAAGSYRIKRSTNIIQCVVDEAGMCSEPETLIPLVATKPIQIVLIGDPKQLRPIIQEPTAKVLKMEISLLERYHGQMLMLTTQYRMHRAICYFPSEAFYDGKLETPPEILQRRSPLQYQIWPSRLPIAFCHSTGPEETLSVRTAEGNEMSKANQQEAEHVVRIARRLIQCGIKPSQIVILSQYRLQCARITEDLKRHRQTAAISARTVIQSQGSEWDFVIISTVRSLPRIEIEENPSVGWRKKFLGFISDENQMNVALTRAKHGLIIVGNKWLLRTHKKWRELLDFYEANHCVVSANSFPRIG